MKVSVRVRVTVTVRVMVRVRRRVKVRVKVALQRGSKPERGGDAACATPAPPPCPTCSIVLFS